MTQFIPSPEQQAIFDAVLNTRANIAISALAGTGKTTSLVELSKRLHATTGSKIFCAFNKDIVNELEGRLTGTGVRASTFHSIGFSALKKYLGAQSIVPQGDKYKKLVDDWGNTDGVLALTLAEAVQVYPQEDRSEKMRDLRKATLSMFVDLLNLARLKLAGWDDAIALQSIINEYALDTDVDYGGLVELVIRNLEKIMQQAEEQTRKLVIDFTDMIYWAVKWNLTFYQYQWVMVDECQDLSPVQREMIARIISPRGGRIILVGDPNQAIYAFAGADSNSFALSAERWHCTVLPLTMTRRCANIITHHASQLVPSFRCPDDKLRGKVVWLPAGSLHRHARIGDMVLSRIKAPLVEQCLALIGEGIPAMILGADIGKALIVILEKITKRKDYSFPDLLKCLIRYQDEQVEIAKRKGDDARAEAIHDQCEAVKFVITAYPDAQSIDALTDKIESLFGDGKKFSEVVTFATIHKSKGLEADRVFILAPDKLPLRAKNMTPEQVQQEGNLDYVARTRAKHTLVYITTEKFLKTTNQPDYVQDDFADKVWDMDEPIAIVEIIEPVVIETPTESPKPVATVDAVFKPDGMFVEAFTPEPLAETPPFAQTVHQFLSNLVSDYVPDTGLSADGETTTMYITTDMDNNFVVYERDYATEDAMLWTRDYKTKDIVNLTSKMQALNPSANAWVIVAWGGWTAQAHAVDEPVQASGDAITDMVAELGGVIEDISSEAPVVEAPVTPSADALLWDMIAQCLKHPNTEAGERLALAIHFSASAYLPLDWADRHAVATLRVAIKRVMREHQYPPSWTKHNMTDVVNDLVHLFQHGSLPAPDTRSPFAIAMTPRIQSLLAGSQIGLFCHGDTTTLLIHIGLDESIVIAEFVYSGEHKPVAVVNLEPALTHMESHNPNPDAWQLGAWDTWYKEARKREGDTHEPEPADTLIEAPQPTVAPISTPTTFSIGENGKATAPTPEPLPATAPDLLKLLIEQFRDFESVELDIVLQAIAYVKREKSDAGVAV